MREKKTVVTNNRFLSYVLIYRRSVYIKSRKIELRRRLWLGAASINQKLQDCVELLRALRGMEPIYHSPLRGCYDCNGAVLE